MDSINVWWYKKSKWYFNSIWKELIETGSMEVWHKYSSLKKLYDNVWENVLDEEKPQKNVYIIEGKDIGDFELDYYNRGL